MQSTARIAGVRAHRSDPGEHAPQDQHRAPRDQRSIARHHAQHIGVGVGARDEEHQHENDCDHGRDRRHREVVQRGEERAVDVCGRPLGDVANKTTPVNGFLDPSPKSKFEGRPEFELESLHRTAMIGTPEQVIERLRYYEQLGVDEFSFWCDNSLPHDEKRKSLELFSKKSHPPSCDARLPIDLARNVFDNNPQRL
jgi:alkanesulfonate monooxygenase SsuD/methylene tetrahydromethanopterin reductase-like flavin-dependent oxidoreductase (luciferase family)